MGMRSGYEEIAVKGLSFWVGKAEGKVQKGKKQGWRFNTHQTPDLRRQT
jgi:hypothetical protein